MTAPFLTVLPTDLQVHVFQTWLSYSARVLQRAVCNLDVACCSKALRPQFLILAARVFNGSEAIRSCCAHARSIWTKLAWLTARGMQVKDVCLQDGGVDDAPLDRLLVIPSVESISLNRSFSDELGILSKSFPNAKSLSVNFYFQNEDTVEFWKLLASLSLNIQTLSVQNQGTPSTCELASNAFRRIGPNLTALSLYEERRVAGLNESCLQLLTKHCHKLQTVDISSHMCTIEHAVQFVAANKDLKSVTLSHLNCRAEEDIGTIITAAQPNNLKHCSISLYIFHYRMLERGDFARILQQFPWLEHFQFQNCGYNRATRKLSLIDSLPAVCWEDILSVCYPVDELAVLCTYGDVEEGFHDLLGKKYGSMLKTLATEVGRSCNQIISQLIVHCVQLVSLTLEYCTDNLLALVARSCQQLLCFTCFTDFSGDITDIGVEALFAGCRKLTSVHLHGCEISIRSLQAIVDNRLPLKALTFNCNSFDMEDVEKFRHLAKEQQLLPVPTIDVDSES